MADFNKSLDVLLSWEGGYANNSNDPGGETYCGISRRNWPTWGGWSKLDWFKKVDFTIKGLVIPWNYKFDSEALDELISQFYLDNFWNKQSFKDLDNQDIADKIFQHYVNMGSRAIKLAQRIVGTKSIREDGKLGELTVGGINNDVVESFLNTYIEDLTDYYEGLVTDHPQLKVFEHEWLLRAKTIGKRP
jgi:type VI secretion system secreted protein VgrG